MTIKTAKLTLAMAVLFLGGIAQANTLSPEQVERVTQYCESNVAECTALAEDFLAETGLNAEEAVMVSMTASEAELAEMGTSAGWAVGMFIFFVGWAALVLMGGVYDWIAESYQNSSNSMYATVTRSLEREKALAWAKKVAEENSVFAEAFKTN